MRSDALLGAGLRAGLLGPGGVTVALSGGPDSTALLLALHDYAARHPGLTLSAAHCNHCLRGAESDRDEEFCRGLCARLGLPLHTERVEVTALRRPGESLETAARRLRYDLLLRAAEAFGADRVATAHNAGDAAETLLWNLARGAGADGLGGIPLSRPLGEGVTVIRPLLAAQRADILRYLEERGEDCVYDSSNDTDDCTRNFLRHEVLPRLETVNPGFVAHAAAAAETLRGESAYLDSLAAPLAAKKSAPAIAAAPEVLARRALRLLCAPYVPSRAQTEALLALCRSGDPSGEVHLGGGLRAMRRYDALVIGPAPERTEPLPPAPIREGENDTPWGRVLLRRAEIPPEPAEGLLVSGRYAPPFLLRPRATGDALTLPGRPRKTLKKLMIEAKLPAADRDRVPVLDIGGAPAAAPGFGTDRSFLPGPGEVCWQILFPEHTHR